MPTFSKFVKVSGDIVSAKILGVNTKADLTSVEKIVTLDGFVGGGAGKAVKGTAGDNVLNGTAKSQLILGRDGNDTIDGKGGVDIIIGGAGSDTLTGGRGGDVFIFETALVGLDTITDYNPDQDFIVLPAAGLADSLSACWMPTLPYRGGSR